MKEGQKFKLIKWNKQLISVATGILLVSQLAVGPVQVLAETTDETTPNSSENIDPESPLDVGMSSELFTADNQKSDGNAGGESQASADRATTRNNLSPQNDTITTQADLQGEIDKIEDSGTIILSDNIEVNNEAINISGKNITLTSANGTTLKRVTNYFGGVFSVTNSGSLTLDNVSIDGNENNKATKGSSLITLTSATFTLKSGTLKNGNARDGGAIYAGSGSSVNIEGGTISNNTATFNGGGIYAEGSTSKVNIEGGIVNGNLADTEGGGIYANDGTVTVSGNGTISDNESNFGGGIYADTGTVIVSGSGTISGNKTSSGTVPGLGGGINAYHSEVKIEGGTISDNESDDGGGINATGGTVTVNGTGIISDNTATSYGGGIHANTGTVTMSGGTISGNESATGGGINAEGGTVTVSGGLVYGEAASVTDLIYDYRNNWKKPIENGVVIAKAPSTTSNSFEWNSAIDLDFLLGENIDDVDPFWTISGTNEAQSVGIAYKDGTEAGGFIPVADTKLKLTPNLLDVSDKTYNGKIQTVVPMDKNECFRKAFAEEVTLTLYQSGMISNRIKDAGYYTVMADVTDEKSTLFSAGHIVTGVNVKKATPTEKDFHYERATDLVYEGEGLTLEKAITAKDESLEHFTVTYVKDNVETETMNEAGTYQIKIAVHNTNNNFNSNQFVLSDATVTVKNAPTKDLYKGTFSKKHTYDGEKPVITITSDEKLGTITPVIKQNNQKVDSSNVGTYQVYAHNDGSEKYAEADTFIGEYEITAKPLTITAEDVKVQQEDLLPALGTVKYGEFATGETEATIFSQLPTANFTTDTAKAGTFEIEMIPGVVTDAANNYTITYQKGTLTVTEKPAEDRVPLYRVYNKNNGEHLYTKSLTEAQGLINKGWQDEGIGWYGGEKTGKAAYRLYNPNSGEHFYTLDQAEYDSVGQAGWNKEGIAFYASEETEIPIYRVFNPNAQDAGSHHYTLSTTENTGLVSEGWRSEGVGFYGK
ncbi:hypothetical protein KUA55_15330 [Enterococcus sp. ALS3]|uniref:DUF5648 domain-containing protein n=1 Tax=Enterococcus alishanensis TaxID=1303817 RepID=A0ABS6TGQ3_9ENTE|nr:hypothetical protein [Enterococcus alishanensis]MBV7392053.1 hypothetical protein [Enterococcus alishanensis]